MPEHIILRCDGAGRFLPFARRRLCALRKYIQAKAYGKTLRLPDARVQVGSGTRSTSPSWPAGISSLPQAITRSGRPSTSEPESSRE